MAHIMLICTHVWGEIYDQSRVKNKIALNENPRRFPRIRGKSRQMLHTEIYYCSLCHQFIQRKLLFNKIKKIYNKQYVLRQSMILVDLWSGDTKTNREIVHALYCYTFLWTIFLDLEKRLSDVWWPIVTAIGVDAYKKKKVAIGNNMSTGLNANGKLTHIQRECSSENFSQHRKDPLWRSDVRTGRSRSRLSVSFSVL